MVCKHKVVLVRTCFFSGPSWVLIITTYAPPEYIRTTPWSAVPVLRVSSPVPSPTGRAGLLREADALRIYVGVFSPVPFSPMELLWPGNITSVLFWHQSPTWAYISGQSHPHYENKRKESQRLGFFFPGANIGDSEVVALNRVECTHFQVRSPAWASFPVFLIRQCPVSCYSSALFRTLVGVLYCM